MERIKNLISPHTRRKKLDLASSNGGGGDQGSPGPSPTLTRVRKMFGVPLEELMTRAPREASVPVVVSRICEYIYKHGLDSVGLFRVSGSVRVVERMRMQFELMGDVNLEEENDVAATAGLLRVFLRDLPDTLIPARLTQSFFSVIKDPLKDRESVVMSIKQALSMLPEENFNLLKYIASLLVVVAAHEAENKMSAYALAIVFGPNVFKYELNSGLGGLRDMDSSKDVMQLFITKYDTLFSEDGDPSPAQFWQACCNPKKSPPPRPPPPKVQSLPLFNTITSSMDSASPAVVTMTASLSSSSLHDYRPVPSPRKMKNLFDSSSSDADTPPPPTLPLHNSIPLYSPREDLDYTRAPSPFGLESETHSIIESPMITARTHEFVEQTIVATISEHIFGGMDFNQNSGPHSPSSPQKGKFDEDDLGMGTSVDVPAIKPRTSLLAKQHSAKASISHSSKDHQRQEIEEELRDFDGLERTGMLTGHKKPLGPPRRSPSRKHRRSWEADNAEQVENMATSSAHQQAPILVSNGTFQNQSYNHTMADGDKENEDFLYKQVLDEVSDDKLIHHNGSESPTIKAKSMRRMESKDRVLSPQSNSFQNGHQDLVSPSGCTSHGHAPTISSPSGQMGGKMELSPTNPIKLFIPPLDLTTLHQHVDGVEAIPVSTEQVSSHPWAKSGQLEAPDNVAIISPRSNKLKKRNGASVNTDIPPSPPIQQDLYRKHSDDECSHRLRQLTKKIQGVKKKIKNFEESFENEHGYRPTQGEKAAQPDIKKYIAELSKARKDLKRLKEETEKGNRSRHNSGASSSGIELSPPATPTVSGTLEFILKCLRDKRQEAGRPDEVTLMTREQVQEEKLAVQRALLHFEGLHGRPTTREEKDLMRPLYDRYRSIKRIIAKPASPRNSIELQTVPEDQMIEIPTFTQRSIPPVHIPTADVDEESPSTPDTGGQDFLVTRDFSLLRDLDLTVARGSEDKVDGGEGGSGRSDDSAGDAHLHELSLRELHSEMDVSRGQKKQLRRVLREYEESFWEKNGRKVTKEDRHPLQNEYGAYKKVKARLRLLEALVLKHHET